VDVREIEIEQIDIPEHRARATFTDEQTAELRASIERNGFTVPILVREMDGGRFELVDGEHRLAVVRELGWERIPAVISQLDDGKASILNVLANTARGAQNPMDVAEALVKARDSGVSIEELAAATGHTEQWVRLYLTLTELPDHYQDALREGKLKVGHVQEAMKLLDPIEIDAALQSVLVHGWTVSVLRYYVEQRAADLEKARAAGDTSFLETPPDPQYANKLVSYGECMTCHRKVNRADLFMPSVCVDCRTLLEWICDQLGDPKEAMQTIFNALNLYYDVTRRNKANMNLNPQASQPPAPEPAPAQSPPAMQQQVRGEAEDEDVKLVKLIKLLRQVGIV